MVPGKGGGKGTVQVQNVWQEFVPISQTRRVKATPCVAWGGLCTCRDSGSPLPVPSSRLFLLWALSHGKARSAEPRVQLGRRPSTWHPGPPSELAGKWAQCRPHHGFMLWPQPGLAPQRGPCVLIPDVRAQCTD